MTIITSDRCLRVKPLPVQSREISSVQKKAKHTAFREVGSFAQVPEQGEIRRS